MYTRPAVTLLVSAAVFIAATLASEPASAGQRPGPERPSGILVALLLPVVDYQEGGVVHLRPTRGGGVRAIVATNGGDPALTYELRLSRLTCRAIKSDPNRSEFDGGGLSPREQFINQVWDDTDIVSITARQLRAARSVVLGTVNGEGKFQPRACGTAVQLEDVLVSSVKSDTVNGYVLTAQRNRSRAIVYTALTKEGAGTLPVLLVASTKPCSRQGNADESVVWSQRHIMEEEGIFYAKSTPKLERPLRRAKSVRVFDDASGAETVQLTCGTYGRGG
jgi:hypothetical protein